LPGALKASPSRRSALAGFVWPLASGVLSGGLFLLVVIPLVSLLVTATPAELLHALSDPLVKPAVLVTLTTTTLSLALIVLCGTPLAWRLATRSTRASRVVETVLQLPVVLPPAVAGVALLLAFGRRGLLGGALANVGVGLPFSRAAVIVAQTFVAAPFYVQAAVTAFRRLDPDLLLVARTLGASPRRVFFTIIVPMSRSGLAGGAALSWARALGEFGATLLFAGNLTGRTQTLPLAIYVALEADVHIAQCLSLVMVAVAFALLVAVRAWSRA
jgi:molybdate transport system permease protein